MSRQVLFSLFLIGLMTAEAFTQTDDNRPRAREIGLVVGIFETGSLNAITDVNGVRVGHSTVIRSEDIRTGVTAIIPAPGNLYTNPIPAWIHVGNGYGKLIGETQVREFGEIETPILLTCTLCVWSAANALKEWVYLQPGMGEHTVHYWIIMKTYLKPWKKLPMVLCKKAVWEQVPGLRLSVGKAVSAPVQGCYPKG